MGLPWSLTLPGARRGLGAARHHQANNTATVIKIRERVFRLLEHD